MDITEALDYDPDTGLFRWRHAVGLRIKPGMIAGSKTDKGYIHIFYKGKCYKAHRLAFMFMNGSMPDDEVDHKDGNGENNKWVNLRGCTRNENQQNLPVYKNNSSGYQGIDECGGRFRARISFNGKRYSSVYFETIEAAINAHAEMKKEIHKFNPEVR